MLHSLSWFFRPSSGYHDQPTEIQLSINLDSTNFPEFSQLVFFISLRHIPILSLEINSRKTSKSHLYLSYLHMLIVKRQTKTINHGSSPMTNHQQTEKLILSVIYPMVTSACIAVYIYIIIYIYTIIYVIKYIIIYVYRCKMVITHEIIKQLKETQGLVL